MSRWPSWARPLEKSLRSMWTLEEKDIRKKRRHCARAQELCGQGGGPEFSYPIPLSTRPCCPIETFIT